MATEWQSQPVDKITLNSLLSVNKDVLSNIPKLSRICVALLLTSTQKDELNFKCCVLQVFARCYFSSFQYHRNNVACSADREILRLFYYIFLKQRKSKTNPFRL